MTEEIISKVKEMIAAGRTRKDVSNTLKISTASIHTILSGKNYNKCAIPIRGLSPDQRRIIENIAKNKSVSQNRLLLSYIRAGIGGEPAQNKIYED